MTFQLRIAALVVLGLVALPGVALAGGDGAKAGERLAGLQAKVDQFVTCLNGQGLEVEGIDVSALREPADACSSRRSRRPLRLPRLPRLKAWRLDWEGRAPRGASVQPRQNGRGRS